VGGGGHDWAGRGLCDGIVIDLSGMKDVVAGSGGARGEDVTEEIFVDAEAVAWRFGMPSRRHCLRTGTVAAVNFGRRERKRA
jgi:hypothetical protein